MVGNHNQRYKIVISLKKDQNLLHNLLETVTEAVELPATSGLTSGLTTDVGRQTRTRKVERVDETERRRSSGSSRRQVPSEVPQEVLVLVDSAEKDLLVFVLESEIESLGREVSDDVGEVASPERQRPLLFRDACETVDDALVLLVGGNLLGDGLDL